MKPWFCLPAAFSFFFTVTLPAATVDTDVRTVLVGSVSDGVNGDNTYVDLPDGSSVFAGDRYQVILEEEQTRDVYVCLSDTRGTNVWTNIVNVPFTKAEVLARDRQGNILLFARNYASSYGIIRKFTVRGRELLATNTIEYLPPPFLRAEEVEIDAHNRITVAHDGGYVSQLNKNLERTWSSPLLPSTRWLQLKVDSKGNSYALGYVPGEGSKLFKLNSSGVPLWTNQFPDLELNALAVDGKGNAYLILPVHHPDANEAFQYPALLKLAPNGSVASTNILRGTNGPSDVVYDRVEFTVEKLATSPRGYIYITGHGFSARASSEYGVLTEKRNADGDQIWASFLPMEMQDVGPLRIPRADNARLEVVVSTSSNILSPEGSRAKKIITYRSKGR
jgi:hypothetical protein